MSKYPNRLSEISLMNDVTTDTNMSFSQNGGGIFDMFSSKPIATESTNELFKLVQSNNYDALKFITTYTSFDISSKDSNGKTILHYIVSNPDSISILKDDKISKRLKSLANVQDNQGNTPAIIVAALAAKTNDRRYNQIIDVLVDKYGADLTIKNKDGEFVGVETEYSPQTKVSVPVNNTNAALSSDISEIPNFMTDIKPQLKAQQPPIVMNTDQMLAMQPLRGGGCGCEKNYTEDMSLTDYIKSNVLGMSHSKKFKGGAIAGQRKLYSEEDVLEDTQNQLKRLADNQGEEIHRRVKEKIREILTKNKKKFKDVEVNDETVNAYKAALWDKIKNDYKDLVKNLDKSIKLEELTTVDNLKSIDVNKWLDILRKYYAEKEKRKPAAPKRQTKKDISDTSDNSIEDLDLEDISATSTSD